MCEPSKAVWLPASVSCRRPLLAIKRRFCGCVGISCGWKVREALIFGHHWRLTALAAGGSLGDSVGQWLWYTRRLHGVNGWRVGANVGGTAFGREATDEPGG